ncbi:dystroglycan 1 isoform X5 [Zeugodacus cucurbitae]|uniref:dystroglycan 1 isoform X5 n=1 Tax=Zeugodacus cucurbitae TaxID=28588 RepID=UPI0023D90D84|nr:dystroglycan 1 isoform X5 [Zeugodacus cucurbitae]
MRRMPKFDLTLSSKASTLLLLFGLACLASVRAERDFNFNDSQVPLLEPRDEPAHIHYGHDPYSVELSSCRSENSEIVLSLVLKSHDWADLSDNKKDKVLEKLSKFFAIPKEFIVMESATKRELSEMQKESIRRGYNKCHNNNKHPLGRVSFVLGCGAKYFTMSEPLMKQIGAQMKDDSIDNITGEKFGWWVIWRKLYKARAQRKRRQTEGSGIDEAEDGDDYDYDYDDDDDDVVESETEVPVTTPPHAHRHHHGDGQLERMQQQTQQQQILKETTKTFDNNTLREENAEEAIRNSAETPITNVFVPIADTTTSSDVIAATTPTLLTTTGEGVMRKDDNETNSLLPETDASRTPPTTPQGSDSASSPTSLLTSPTTSTLGTSPTSISTDATAPTLPSTDYVEPKVENTPPMIRTRLQKFAVTSGKAFSYSVPQDTFYDTEDLTNLRLDLTDKDGRELKASSWLQFNPETHVLYGLPLDDSVSKWQYRLTATDSGNESVTETLEISVQQHRGVRTVNHEISITVKINEKNIHNIDWQLKLMRDVASTLGDENTNSLVVREIRPMPQDPNTATFVYFNETFPTSECPEAELNKLVKRLDASRLSDLVYPTLSVKSITGQLIGACQKSHITKPKPTTHMATNVPPLPRNQVDRVNATVGHLLVFKVPSDTFYDPNDNEQLTLTLKTKDHKELNPRHWLQFDSKNQEFYGIPKSGDAGSDEYLLVAQDAGGLSATDALVVVVNHAPKKEFSVYFKAYLAIRHEQFNADLQRKFVERISQLFGDSTTQYVQIRSVTTQHDSDSTIVNFYNTSLYKSHNRCPEEEIEAVRSVYLIKDHMVRDHVKKILGPELNLTNVQALPLGLCHPQTDIIHRDYVPTKPDQPTLKSSFSEEYMYTIILPAVIIVSMILIACLIACCLHRRRRKSGKMELGDEEERRSFRKKNIPVIFQDELDEKPEIGNKSPIILKDEKPPLLPPSYNTSNMNGDNDVDEYVPPPAVVVGGREARGKSPATPSYRKPPPYVSP